MKKGGEVGEQTHFTGPPVFSVWTLDDPVGEHVGGFS
jgi:hypothetical protein